MPCRASESGAKLVTAPAAVNASSRSRLLAVIRADKQMECGFSGADGRGQQTMLDKAKRLLTPSQRSDVPPFIVMDVMAAAARIEAAGGHVIHMEVGQPAAPAPATAIAAAQAALANGRIGYTEALGIPSLRAAHRAALSRRATASRSIRRASS